MGLLKHVEKRICVRRVKVSSALFKLFLNLVASHRDSQDSKILIELQLATIKIGPILERLFDRRSHGTGIT